MSEPLYILEEFCTTGWEVVQNQLTKLQASKKLEELINLGVNPDNLRVRREL